MPYFSGFNMKIKNIKFINAESIAGFTLAIAGIFLFFSGFFENLEMKTLDQRFMIRTEYFKKLEKKGLKISGIGQQSIVNVPLTDKCLKNILLDEGIKTYPLPRDLYADVINFLSKSQAKIIGIDLFFDIPSPDLQKDLNFIKAVKDSKNVVLPIIFDSRQVFEDGRLIDKKQVLRCFNQVSSNAVNQGFINVKYETLQDDGVFRKIGLLKSLENLVYPSFSLACAASFIGADINSLSIVNSIIYDNTGKIKIPLYADKNSETLIINYLPEKSPFITIPFSKVLKWAKMGSEGLKNGEHHFKNKLIIIGPDITAEDDFHITPYGKVPGMSIHAQIIRSIIDKDYITRFKRSFTGTSILFFSFIFIVFLSNSSSIAAFTVFISALVLYIAFAFYIFIKKSIMLPIIPIAVIFISITLTVRFIKLYMDLWRTNNILDRKVNELTTLYDISRSISKTLITDKEKRINLVLDKSLASIGAQRGSLMLLDPLTEELVVETVRGAGVGQVQKTRLKPGQGIAGMVFESAAPLIINKGEKDNRFLGSSSYSSEIINMLCVPLLVNENPIGVLNLVNKTDNSNFTDSDSKLAMTIAQQAASVIENARLYRLATIDGLTELYVHRHFQIRLEEELRRANRYSKALSLMITDIDHFKGFNDTYGHQTGDVVLKAVSKVIRDTVRDIDLPARYGGEEFGIILPETDIEGAKILAERLRKKVEELEVETSEYGVLSVTISIGVACFPTIKTEDRKVLIEFADSALYHSKENGRNKVTLACPGMKKPT
jgi:diguanylate cyclase (GGDEF)-like protein